MNVYLRLSIAVLVSLLAHVVLLMWVMQQVRERLPDEHGLLQVYLSQHTGQPVRQSSLQSVETALSTTKKTADRQMQKPTDTARQVQDASSGRPDSGHFRWQPPSTYQQNEILNAMQLAQMAHQREAHAGAVMAGLSNLSAQLRPVITASIVCTQQVDNEIDCIPAPKDQERILLEQFFNLASEAHRLGVAGNPVHMDFGPELGISINFLH